MARRSIRKQMELFIAIDPGKTCGVCIASCVVGEKFRLEAVNAVECACMSRPEEVVAYIDATVHRIRSGARPPRCAEEDVSACDKPAKHSKSVRLGVASLTIGVETQFSHAGSIRNEAWLSGALWSWSQRVLDAGTPLEISMLSGQSRLKLPSAFCAAPRKLPASSGVTKTQRRTIVKAFARSLVDQVFRERSPLLDLDPVEDWYKSICAPAERGKARRVHDAIDAVLLMLVLAGKACDVRKRSEIKVRRAVLPLFASAKRLCDLQFENVP